MRYQHDVKLSDLMPLRRIKAASQALHEEPEVEPEVEPEGSSQDWLQTRDLV